MYKQEDLVDLTRLCYLQECLNRIEDRKTRYSVEVNTDRRDEENPDDFLYTTGSILLDGRRVLWCIDHEGTFWYIPTDPQCPRRGSLSFTSYSNVIIHRTVAATNATLFS
jgi:hypothetical protein